jgi:hypothetical protein
MPDKTPIRTRALALFCLALLLSSGVRLLLGPPGAIIHVRWQPSTGETERAALERRYSLAEAHALDGSTWRYELTDPSDDNIRALVDDPAVADTHYLNRSTYSVDAAAVRTARHRRLPSLADRLIMVVDASASVLAAAAILLLLLGRVPRIDDLRRSTASVRAMAGDWARPVQLWLERWIPPLDGRALGGFRIAVGIGFVWAVASMQPAAIPASRQAHRAAVDLTIIHQIAASGAAAAALQQATILAAALFTLGLWSRATYALVTLGFFMLTLLNLEVTSAHDLGLPLVTFIGWLAVPWGDSRLGVDEWRRKRSGFRPLAPPNSAYGFAIWWPGLTLGVALLAAAYAKLEVSGLGWITGGAVKYHFITDFGAAVVDWGLWVASHPQAAVFLSFGAIFVEAFFILNIFARTPRWRAAAGLSGAGMFLGLRLFQGIYWPAWLMLLAAFLPWPWLNASPDSGTVRSTVPRRLHLRPLQAGAIALLIGSQLYASSAQIEAEPLLSNFPMYAHNYGSPEQFDFANRWRLTRILEVDADGESITSLVQQLNDNDRTLLMDLAEHGLVPIQELGEGGRRSLALLCERYQQVIGPLPASIAFRMERRKFAWDEGRFRDYKPVSSTPVPLAAQCRQIAATGTTSR